MTYPILVEPVPDRGYLATALGMPDCVCSATTEAEAIRGVRAAIADRLSKGKLVQVEIPGTDDPWTRWIGSFAADPTWDEFQALIAAERKSIDAEPDHA
jgi:hypothetical protein